MARVCPVCRQPPHDEMLVKCERCKVPFVEEEDLTPSLSADDLGRVSQHLLKSWRFWLPLAFGILAAVWLVLQLIDYTTGRKVQNVIDGIHTSVSNSLDKAKTQMTNEIAARFKDPNIESLMHSVVRKEAVERIDATANRIIATQIAERIEPKLRSADAKIAELDKTLAAAKETLAELRLATEFVSTVTAAKNDDRQAFDKLLAWVNRKDFPYWQNAADAVIIIRTDYGGPIQRGHLRVSWPDGLNTKKLSLERLRREYRNAMRVYKADLVETVWESEIIGKRDKMAFFVEVLRGDGSLGATYLAGKYFVEATEDKDLKWSPFSTKPLLDWWETHDDALMDQQ